MNLTLRLIGTIGSPFVLDQTPPKNKSEALELYSHAIKNKIGLLYLESLKDQEKLEEFGLKPEYQKQCMRYNEQLTTAIRISKLFNSLGVNYAIFKSIMPFPAIPNDIDIIHFGSAKEYKNLVEILLNSGYMEVKCDVDTEQRTFHDTRMCKHPNTPEKDVYDVDIYQKISASHIVYLDKRKLENHVTEINMSNDKIKVLKPEAELVVIAIHSIIPEQLHTLLAYYATLYYFKKMTSKELDRFIRIARDNNVVFPVRVHCSLVAKLHQVGHGFIPERMETVLDELGNVTSEIRKFARNNFKMPHRYSWSVIIKTLLEKAKEGEFRRSALKQVLSMANPKLAKWVVWNIIWRRRRETY